MSEPGGSIVRLKRTGRESRLPENVEVRKNLLDRIRREAQHVDGSARVGGLLMNNRFLIYATVTVVFAGMMQAQSYTPTDLGVLPTGLSSYAQAINDQAAVVGYCILGNDSERAFFWSSTMGMRDLGTLKSDTDSYAQAVNNSGQVAGVSYSRVTGVLHAFLWSQAEGMQDLGTLGGTSSFA